jgi:hypothetical protein
MKKLNDSQVEKLKIFLEKELEKISLEIVELDFKRKNLNLNYMHVSLLLDVITKE